MTPNDFLKILLEASNKCTDPAPKGWYSKNELCKVWNIKKTACKERITSGIKLLQSSIIVRLMSLEISLIIG